MGKFIVWISSEENLFFVAHVLAVFVLALVAESVAGIYTTLTFPTLLFLAAASFMYNYPVKAIKAHGLFSEFLIEMRLLWLLIIGILFEYLALELTEHRLSGLLALVAFLFGIIVVFFSRARLQEKLVKQRGFE